MATVVNGFKCDLCGHIHVALEKAELCESSHGSKPECNFTFEKGKSGPDSILVNWTDEKGNVRQKQYF